MNTKLRPPTRTPLRLWLTLLLLLLLVPAQVLAACSSAIVEASYSSPTTRYAHGVLGDDIEYGALEVTLGKASECTNGSAQVTVELPQSLVFEDTAPRLWDVDGDDKPEVVTVESSTTRGARLTVWTVAEGELVRLASTPHIGQAYRWLAPIGAADLDGDGLIEIAYIDRPHLAKRLRVWRFQSGKLQAVADQPRLTNHRIGDRTISSDLQYCQGQPQLITANADWTAVMATTLQNGQLRSVEVGPMTRADDVFKPIACAG